MGKIEFSPGFILYLSAGVLILPLHWLIGLLISGIVHELGHIISLRLMNLPVKTIAVGPFGAKITTVELTNKQELLAALAGPLAGLLLVFFLPVIPQASLCALIQTIINIFPIGNSDGARILRVLRCPDIS